MTTHIEKSTLKFLKDLAKNNNRPWFKEHKDRYDAALQNMKDLMQSIEAELNKVDEIESQKVFRVYRDVRFSKDKSPYKTYFGGSFTRATAARRGGYYLGIQPGGQSMIAGGFWNPNKEDIKRVRDEIALDDKELRKIISRKSFKDLFGTLEGEELKRVPRGYNKDHPAGDLLKKKQYLCYRKASDTEVCSPDFLSKITQTYKGMRPFFDWMSVTLTTNLDGESII